MLKNQLIMKSELTQSPKKACFGTKEFSANSGICNRCNYKDSCGKADGKRKG
ncbi:MAG: hypothetical protein Q7R52_01485 [archaeon]|nr:hypothetical protein [archaeon]